MMIYWMIRFLFPQYNIQKVAIIGLNICCLVEFSQLYQADWINIIRSNRLGRLVLGQVFLWSDFAAYLFGIGMVAGIENYCKKTNKAPIN